MVIALCSCMALNAQTKEVHNIVELCNGSVIKCNILSLDSVQVKLESSDGSIFVFNTKEVSAIKRVEPESTQSITADNNQLPQISFYKRRYRGGDLAMKRKEFRLFLRENCPRASVHYEKSRSLFVSSIVCDFLFWPIGLGLAIACESQETKALDVYNQECAVRSK